MRSLKKYNNNAFSRVVYTESHDEVANGKSRVPEEISPGAADSEYAKKRAVLGMVLTMTAPGIPMIFQGQEFIEDEYFKDDAALDWNRYESMQGITKLFKDLADLRSRFDSPAPGLKGQFIRIIHCNQESKVLAYLRSHAEDMTEATLVVLNFSIQQYDRYTLGLPMNQGMELHFNSMWSGYDNDFSQTDVSNLEVYEEAFDDFPNRAVFDLPGYGALIFS